jgi:N-methylhydantoinase B
VIEIESAIGADFELLSAFDRIDYPPRGRNGGRSGDSGEIRLASGERLRGKGTQTIKAGERLIIHTPGGGGYGNPADRDPQRLQEDIENGLVMAEAGGTTVSRTEG